VLPKEIEDLLKLPEVTIIPRKPKDSIMPEAYLLEITSCDESCIHKVIV